MTLEETIGGGRMSGMDELLDEAIAKAKETGDSQLVEWLRMARGGKSAARWYAIKLHDLEAENTKLRRMVRVYRACHDHINACRGCDELPECDALRRLRELGREVGIEVD